MRDPKQYQWKHVIIIGRPVRPPRPPTADSPTLSESVYLACADQPYIVVAPQPFTDIDLSLDRHSRTRSAPLFGRATNDEISGMPESIVVQRLLKLET
jgi:hypothetical protein